MDCWIFISDKHHRVAQWALVYSFLNVKGSQTQPRDSFQHCSEDFGESGKVMNGMNVLFSPNEGWMWSPHRESWGWKMGNGELEIGSWTWGMGDGELEVENSGWRIQDGELGMESWKWRIRDKEPRLGCRWHWQPPVPALRQQLLRIQKGFFFRQEDAEQ